MTFLNQTQITMFRLPSIAAPVRKFTARIIEMMLAARLPGSNRNRRDIGLDDCAQDPRRTATDMMTRSGIYF